MAINGGRSQNFLRGFEADLMGVPLVAPVLQNGEQFAGNRGKTAEVTATGGGGNPNCLGGFAPDTKGRTMVVLVPPLGKRFGRKRREKWRLGFFSGAENSGNGGAAPRDGAESVSQW